MASEDLQLDLSAGLVFAMILIYYVFLDAAYEPSQPAEDSFKITFLFREEPYTYQHLTSVILPAAQPPMGPYHNLSRPFLEITQEHFNSVGYKKNGVGWECSLDKNGFTPQEMLRYEKESTDVPIRINRVDDEDVEIAHSLNRLVPDFPLSPGDDPTRLEVEAVFKNYISDLPILNSTTSAVWFQPVRIYQCKGDFFWHGKASVTRRFISGTREKGFATCGWGYPIETFSSEHYNIADFRDVSSKIQSLTSVVPVAPGPEDDELQSFLATVSDRPFVEFGAFSCQGSAIAIANATTLNVRLEGWPVAEPLRELKILAMSIESRSNEKPVVWSAWGNTEFPGTAEFNNNGIEIVPTNGQMIRISAPTTFRIEL
jgi:hypothetical protein